MSSIKKFHLRKKLYLIGQTMGSTDVNSFKFLCNYELPRRRLERIETAFELFCALESEDMIGYDNEEFLRRLLEAVHKQHLLNEYPLCHPTDDDMISLQTDSGGVSPKDQLSKLHFFLKEIGDSMSHREVRTFALFVCDLIVHGCSYEEIEKFDSANDIFLRLLTAGFISPTNLNILSQVFEVIGRNDLRQRINHYNIPTHLSFTSETSSSNNSLLVSSVPSTPSSFSSQCTQISSPEEQYESSLPSSKRVSLDHSGTKPSAPPLPHAYILSPGTPHYNSQTPFVVPGNHYTTQRPYSVPSSTGESNLVNAVSEKFGMPHTTQHSYSVPSSTGESNLVDAITEEFGMPHTSTNQENTVTTPVIPKEQPQVNVGIGVNQGQGNILYPQPTQDRLVSLNEQLISTMEYQRSVISDLMKERDKEKQVKNVTPVSSSSSGEVSRYAMNSFPHGLAIVLGNNKFTVNPARPKLELADRKGCDVDVGSFKSIFHELQYDIRPYQNLKAEEIEELINRIASHDHTKYDSFVFCISSHGEGNHFVFGTDSITVDIYALIDKLKQCPTLAGKPKLFFIQACRVAPVDLAVSDGGSLLPRTNNPEADVYIAWATTRNQSAYRSPTHGSWFVAAMKEVLLEKSPYLDLVSMMYDVTHLVCKAEGQDKESKQKVQQCVETNSQLRGAVFFSKNSEN